MSDAYDAISLNSGHTGLEGSLEQVFYLRPGPGYADHRTPIEGLNNASSATRAGGGVCEIDGMRAAGAAIIDARARRRTSRSWASVRA
jgi:phytoene dehydrogenase-like protein